MKIKIRNLRKNQMILLLTVMLLGMIAGCGKKEEDYRQIQVHKIEGTATIERQGSSMEVYDNMQLHSGDMVETAADSYLQLKLDEDKYIMLEPQSKISLQATGNSVDSNTSIFLEKGAIVNQIDNPLSEDSSYQVTTPNSTMAVRGTTFRVEITYDEKGESYAEVAVYGGKVECNLVFPDGTIAEPLLAEAGTAVLVWGDDKESDYVETGNVTYEELKEKVIDFLGVIIDRGEELSITKEEIVALKEALQTIEESGQENKDGDTQEEESDHNSEDSNQDSEDLEQESEDSSEEEERDHNTEKTLNEESSDEEKKEDEKIEETPVETPVEAPTETPVETPTETPTVTPPPTTGDSNTSGTTGGNSNTGNSNKEITINFCLSDNTVFATKKMSVDAAAGTISGAEITSPVLQPAASGSWGYTSTDNINIVNNTVTINWVN